MKHQSFGGSFRQAFESEPVVSAVKVRLIGFNDTGIVFNDGLNDRDHTVLRHEGINTALCSFRKEVKI